MLRVSPVGINDEFLDLGGHSLKAAQIVTRALDEFQVDVGMETLLGAPTVAKMALVVTRKMMESTASDEMAGLLDAMDELEGDVT